VMHGLYMQDSGRRQIMEKDAALDFRLDNRVVNVVRQIRVRGEHGNTELKE